MKVFLAIAWLIGVTWSQSIFAHAFPERMEPRVGVVTASPPGEVHIWFDADLEPTFSTLRVLDANGRQVNQDPARVSIKDASLLEVRLPQLAPGTYHVFWRVIVRDGHATEGDYTFTVGR
jgi:methionine-rich copper-binding protein CopC